MDALNIAMLRSKLAGNGSGYVPPSTPPSIPPPIPSVPEPSVADVMRGYVAPLLARIKHLEQRINALEISKLPESSGPQEKPRPHVSLIIISTEQEFGLQPGDIKHATRRVAIALARHVAMYIACRLTLRTIPEIGKAFGDRDSSTVIHGRDRIAMRRKDDAELNQHILNIEQALLA